MRPLEILSLALLLVTIIFLFFRKERTFFLIMLFSTIGTTIAGFLQSWANQGVLLLNNVLTVEQGRANSHKDCG